MTILAFPLALLVNQLKAQPSSSFIREQLQLALPSTVSIVSFEVKASENQGSQINPVWKSRFVAKGTAKEELYWHNETYLDTLVMVRVTQGGESAEIYGVATATLQREQWIVAFTYEDNFFLNDKLYVRGIPKSKLPANSVVSGTEKEKDLIERTLIAILDENFPDRARIARSLYEIRKENRAKPILSQCIYRELNQLLDEHFSKRITASAFEMNRFISELGQLKEPNAVYTLLRARTTVGMKLAPMRWLRTAASEAIQQIGPYAIPEMEKNYDNLMNWISSDLYRRYLYNNTEAMNMEVPNRENITEYMKKIASDYGLNINIPSISSAITHAPALKAIGEKVITELFDIEESKEVVFNVQVLGTIQVEVSWKGGPAGLLLQLYGPQNKRKGLARLLHRPDQNTSGRSPLKISQEVTNEILARGTTWKVIVSNFRREGRAIGTLKIKYPE